MANVKFFLARITNKLRTCDLFYKDLLLSVPK